MRRNITITMAEQNFPCFQGDTGCPQSAPKGVFQIVHSNSGKFRQAGPMLINEMQHRFISNDLQ